MTDTLKTAPESELRQVLEALEFFAPGDDAEAQAAIAALRKRLEEAPATEPQGERVEAFDSWWASEIKANGGVVIGADYRHWAEKGYRASLSASTPSAVSAETGGKYLTVVYRNIQPGDEARALIDHPKMSAASWSHALHDRDAAKAAAMAPPADNKENGK